MLARRELHKSHGSHFRHTFARHHRPHHLRCLHPTEIGPREPPSEPPCARIDKSCIGLHRHHPEVFQNNVSFTACTATVIVKDFVRQNQERPSSTHHQKTSTSTRQSKSSYHALGLRLAISACCSSVQPNHLAAQTTMDPTQNPNILALVAVLLALVLPLAPSSAPQLRRPLQRHDLDSATSSQVHSASPSLWNLCNRARSSFRWGFFHYMYHTGCAFNLHSIINNGLIPGGQELSRRQTVFFLPFDRRDESHKDPEHIDFSVPRRARYLHSAWQKHQDAVFWVDIDLAIKEGLTFDQTRSNAIILQETLPAYCIPKVVRLKT